MPNPGKVTVPRSDDEYFARMTRALFAAGLNWKMIENKWPNFKKAFSDFNLVKVAKLSEKDIKKLLTDTGIVRNEKKIRATVYNAGEFIGIGKEAGSFKKYLESFGKDEERLQVDLKERFHHLGPSSARMFLWLAGYRLTPNADEKAWMPSHH